MVMASRSDLGSSIDVCFSSTLFHSVLNRIGTFPLHNGLWCVEFAYHMYGATIDQLDLYRETPTGDRYSMWSEKGAKGDIWLQANVSFPIDDGDKVRIVEYQIFVSYA